MDLASLSVFEKNETNETILNDVMFVYYNHFGII